MIPLDTDGTFVNSVYSYHRPRNRDCRRLVSVSTVDHTSGASTLATYAFVELDWVVCDLMGSTGVGYVGGDWF